jgi:hypothetical protein
MKIGASIHDADPSGREGNEFACLFFPFFPFPFPRDEQSLSIHSICMKKYAWRSKQGQESGARVLQ